jgi:hypothetical protein
VITQRTGIGGAGGWLDTLRRAHVQRGHLVRCRAR